MGSIFGFLATAAVWLVNTIFNSAQANDQHNTNARNLQASLNAQKEENQLNREYNLNLAQQQNEWNLEQWNRENAYNDPTAQLSRMRSAGLNPDMMYGGGVSGNVAASSPQMTAGAPSVPMDWSALAGRQTSAESYNKILQNRLLEAQIDNVKSVTDKNVSDTDLNVIESQFRAQILQGEISESNMRIKLGGSQLVRNSMANKLDAQKIEESRALMQKWNQEAQESMARIRNMADTLALENRKVNISEALSKAQIAELATKCDLNTAQANQINELLEKVSQSYDDAHEAHLENMGIVRIEKGVIEFDANTKTSREFWLDDRNWIQNLLRYVDMFTDSLDGIITPVTKMNPSKGSGITINNNM